MSATAPEPSVREISEKVEALTICLRWMLLAMLILASTINYWSAVGISKFQQIFTDALPGKPLPDVTLLLIYGKHFFIFFAPVWLVLGVSFLVMAKKPKTWVLGSLAILFLILFQIFVTWVGCLMPMVGI